MKSMQAKKNILVTHDKHFSNVFSQLSNFLHKNDTEMLCVCVCVFHQVR